VRLRCEYGVGYECVDGEMLFVCYGVCHWGGLAAMDVEGGWRVTC
jgi:hypothetical protein